MACGLWPVAAVWILQIEQFQAIGRTKGPCSKPQGHLLTKGSNNTQVHCPKMDHNLHAEAQRQHQPLKPNHVDMGGGPALQVHLQLWASYTINLAHYYP